ncbi:NDMA-dependent alcohol dehydrogenase [Rhodococcus qingshengii]|uniref:NDMA-dependent alcohol dehydrogenase n=1 Tax=Rhodococcus qingshengii TaxID=334542 RepID=UPI001E5930E8|nr:NDMA-dependent alcohol dehydrogenase [Rhodococcus qingshengii]MCD2135930.1 NDMA-dependent alcohol dehydrogenase [Rhodococcus qingshengii]
MTIPAAILHTPGPDAQFVIEEVTLDPPKGPEVKVQLAASGLCHSDEHLRYGAYNFDWSPCLGGHEGAGVIVEVGDQVTDLKVGDHVVLTFIPSCGRCRACATGHSNLCDMGAELFSGVSVYDRTHRFHWKDKGVGQFVQLGTFAPYTVVHQNSAVKIDKRVPLDKAALVGCGVTTGFGSAAWAADTEIGDTAVVVGTGGLGMNAVQGFRLAGASNIIAVDPHTWKTQLAVDQFGATHQASSMKEAKDLIHELTDGRMADRLVYTVGDGLGSDIEEALSLIGKLGVMVFVAVANSQARDAKIDLFTLTHYQQQLRGALFGAANPRIDIPKILDLYMKGEVKLDELVTRTYSLDQVNQGYTDLIDGKNIRGVITFNH